MTEGELSDAGDRLVEMLEAERYEEALGVNTTAGRAEITAAFVRLSARYSADERARIALNKARGAILAETDLQRGSRLERLDESDGAVDCFRRAVSQNGGLPAYRRLGQALSRLDREEEAIPFLEQAVQLGDEAADYHWLGSSLAALGRHKQALPHLREAVLRRGWASDHEWLATALLELGRKAESLPHLRRVVELEDDSGSLHRLGRTLAELGQLHAAIPYLEKAVTHRGTDADCHWFGRTLAELGRNYEALPHLEQAVSLRGDGEDYYWLGRTLAAMDCKEAAVDHLFRAAEDRGDASDYQLLGTILADLGQEDEAVPYLILAVEERGDLSDYQYLGQTFLNLGENEGALTCFEELVRRRGAAADHHWLGRVLLKLGRQDEALPHFMWTDIDDCAEPACVNCGEPCEPTDRFCNDCSSLFPSGIGQIDGRSPSQMHLALAPLDISADVPEDPPASVRELPASSERTLAFVAAGAVEEVPTAPSPILERERAPVDIAAQSPDDKSTSATGPPAQPESAPYAIFISLVLGSALFISPLVFNTAQAFARNRWDSTISIVVATTAAVLLARSAWSAWRRIVVAEPGEDDMLKRRHRRVLGTSGVILVLFFTASAIVGAAIGKSRVEAVQLSVDLERMTAVGNRISKTRSAVEATIASYIVMYKAIEPDVQDLESTLGRLITELGVYDGKFPTQHEQTAKSIAGMETGLQRVTLIKKQIEAAKQIDALDPGQQFAAWKMQMLPLLASEEALDKPK